MSLPLLPDRYMTVLPDGFALASFLSHWFKDTLAECRAELARAMLRRWCFSGEAQRTLFLSLFRREGGLSGPPSFEFVIILKPLSRLK